MKKSAGKVPTAEEITALLLRRQRAAGEWTALMAHRPNLPVVRAPALAPVLKQPVPKAQPRPPQSNRRLTTVKQEPTSFSSSPRAAASRDPRLAASRDPRLAAAPAPASAAAWQSDPALPPQEHLAGKSHTKVAAAAAAAAAATAQPLVKRMAEFLLVSFPAGGTVADFGSAFYKRHPQLKGQVGKMTAFLGQHGCFFQLAKLPHGQTHLVLTAAGQQLVQSPQQHPHPQYQPAQPQHQPTPTPTPQHQHQLQHQHQHQHQHHMVMQPSTCAQALQVCTSGTVPHRFLHQ